MSKMVILAVFAVGAVLCGALIAFAAVSGESHDNAGRMTEVVVTASAPAMMLDEVVVRPSGLNGDLMPEVVVNAPGPRLVVAAPRPVPTELN